LAVEYGGLPPDLMQFLFQSPDLQLKVFAHFLNDDRLGEFGQYKQQYDGPKRTADDVQERQAEDFYISSFLHVGK
jgi:hypothetical protein